MKRFSFIALSSLVLIFLSFFVSAHNTYAQDSAGQAPQTATINVGNLQLNSTDANTTQDSTNGGTLGVGGLQLSSGGLNNAAPSTVPTTLNGSVDANGKVTVTAPASTPTGSKTNANAPQFTCITYVTGSAGLLPNGIDVQQCAAEGIYYLILTPLGWVLWLTGELLDLSISFSIFKMHDFMAGPNSGIIQAAWTTFRDLSNLFFIAILIYISVITVLGLGDWKKMISSVIITALLINFSLFFTEVIVDASNIFTLQFYEKVATVQSISTGTGDGISAAIMNPLKLTLIYNNQANATYAAATTIAAGNLGLATGVATVAADKIGAMITTMLLGSIMILITSFVFLAAAILFITRFVVIIALLIFSPLAFAGIALPKMKGLVTNKWWDALMDQCIFAPAFMVMIWVTIRIISSPSFSSFLTPGGAPALSIDTITTGGSSTVTLILNFAVVIGFMLLSIIVAKTLGAKGADFAVKAAGNAIYGTSAWVGRNTVGRAAAGVANSEGYKNTIGRIPILGKLGKYGLEGTAKSNFDLRSPLKGLGADVGKAGGKGGYTAEEKRRRESTEKYGEFMGKGEGGEERVKNYTNTLKNNLIYRAYLGKNDDGEGANISISGKIKKKWNENNIKKLQAQLKIFKKENPTVRDDIDEDDPRHTGAQKEYTELKKTIEEAKQNKKETDESKKIADKVKEETEKSKPKDDSDGEEKKADKKKDQ